MSRQMLVALLAIVLLIAVVFIFALNSSPKPEPMTKLGEIKIELYPDKAPETVKNFLQYVEDKHYDGTIFHRVIPDFMIQGGGYKTDLTEKRTRSPIRNEAMNGLHNERGTIAMARTPDPHSATAQFFINVEDNTMKLDPAFSDGHGYAVFGKVIEGMNVVDRIRASPTFSKSQIFQNLPVQDVIIKSARRDTSVPDGAAPVVILEIEQAPRKRS